MTNAGVVDKCSYLLKMVVKMCGGGWWHSIRVDRNEVEVSVIAAGGLGLIPD